MNQDLNEWSRGWRALVSASVGNALGFGLFVMTAALFIIPMQEEFGWSRSAVSIGSIVTLFAAMAVIAIVTSGVIFCAGIVPRFRRNSGLAIGITMSGLSLIAAAVLPALAWLICAHRRLSPTP